MSIHHSSAPAAPLCSTCRTVASLACYGGCLFLQVLPSQRFLPEGSEQNCLWIVYLEISIPLFMIKMLVQENATWWIKICTHICILILWTYVAAISYSSLLPLHDGWVFSAPLIILSPELGAYLAHGTCIPDVNKDTKVLHGKHQRSLTMVICIIHGAHQHSFLLLIYIVTPPFPSQFSYIIIQ